MQSAVMAGLKVVSVKVLPDGSLDIEDLRAKAQQHKDDLAARWSKAWQPVMFATDGLLTEPLNSNPRPSAMAGLSNANTRPSAFVDIVIDDDNNEEDDVEVHEQELSTQDDKLLVR